MRKLILAAAYFVAIQHGAVAADANRLTYLDEFCDPYYASLAFPKLITAQWVGEPGVEAVITLGIDDLRDTRHYEVYLRPILERLKEIDGRAPVSLMANKVDPNDPQLPTWLKEGLSIETHTADHPCPCLQGGDFAQAKSTYDRCVDQMASIPGSHPVAFRFPCMDSRNTPSPRAFAEIFNKTTPAGNFLRISSSVCVLLTADDPDLPEKLVKGDDGQSRFERYVPFPSFVNKVEDYPYPFVIARLCWEFPCAVPDDWQGHNLQTSRNPKTVADMQACIDATVLKRGVYNMIFHPHGWIRTEQVRDIVDYVDRQYGKRVKFLTFAECHERLTKHLLAGEPLRGANGQDNGVRLLDLNHDGFMDVVIGNERLRQTRIWDPPTARWIDSDFPVQIVNVGVDGTRTDSGVRFAVFRDDGFASFLIRNEDTAGVWHFDGRSWIRDDEMLTDLDVGGEPILTARNGQDDGLRLRDLDSDGCCELIAGRSGHGQVFSWDRAAKAWSMLPFTLPPHAKVVDDQGRDFGLRFVDLDEDGQDDILFSNEDRFGIHLFESMERGWNRQVRSGVRGAEGAVPLLVRGGTNGGAWFAKQHLWLQNEDTHRLPDGVDRRSFRDLLGDALPGPRSPEASRSSIRVPQGFEVQLVAAEPLVTDPVAFDWGPDGKLWVVEMGDYPLGVDGKGAPGGRVRFLQDTGGDGVFDRSTLFLDGLSFPTGVMAWRRGVLVTAAPELFYAEDTDGDGKADKREVLFRGFGEGNQQHRVNGLRWGLDNWVYLANGDSGGRIESLKTRQATQISGRDVRIRPDEGLLDPETGTAQFGRDCDDWGNWFGCNNANPHWHYVLTDRYVRRNPRAAMPELRLPVSVTPGTAEVFPLSRTLERFNTPQGANRFTSACSAMIYRDDLLGAEFAGNSFVCEPVHNLVHREVLSAKGITFTSRRPDGEQRSEFLASSDNWFRPTMVRTGPDGALWVADMYRAVIEHPQWIPADWQKRLDLRAGHDRGRIYRIVPKANPPRRVPRFDRLDISGLVAALDSPNGWQRDMAQQMLIWRADPAAIEPLETAARSADRPLTRLHALCTLDGLGALKPSLVAEALRDPHAGVRRHAVRLAEPIWNDSPELGRQAITLIEDPDPQIQLQLACSLGSWQHREAGPALAILARKHHGDPHLRAAVMTSLNERNIGQVLEAALADGAAPQQLIEQLLAQAIALGGADVVAEAFQAIAAAEGDRPANWRLAACASMLDAMKTRKLKIDSKTLGQLGRLFEKARATAADRSADPKDRLVAIRLLGRETEHRAEDVALLASLLLPQNAAEIQSAAVTALARQDDPQAAETLLKSWKSFTPGLRSQVLDVLLSTQPRTAFLLKAMESGLVDGRQVDAARRQQLLEHRNPSVRENARRILAKVTESSREQVVQQHQDVLGMPGDRERGREVFSKKCAACHRLDGVGEAVGPDLAALSDRSPGSLLVAILDPSRAVEDKFLNYNAVDADGRQFTGMLLAESGASLTLAGQDGKKQVLARTDLEFFESTGKSMMPDGLEQDISKHDLADVIAYVSQMDPPPKQFPGNQPALVQPDRDGAFLLSAENCKIFGSSLVFEAKYRNLGYWTAKDDRAAWSLNISRGGSYRVEIEYACDNSVAGNRYELHSGDARLGGRVDGTGTWDDYRKQEIGTLDLAAGAHQLVFRPAGSIRGALIDLRSIRLIPQDRAQAKP